MSSLLVHVDANIAYGWPPSSCGVEHGQPPWGTVCHYVERGESRFLTSRPILLTAFALLVLALPGLAWMISAQVTVPAVPDAPGSAPSIGPARPLPEYRAVPRKSTVRFKAETGVPLMPVVQGSVQRYEVRGWIDPSNPTASRGEVIIDMRSVKSESLLVSDSAIRAQLQVDQYPTATLRTLAVRNTDRPNVFEVDVELVSMSKAHRSSVRVEAVRFESYIRLIGTYRGRSEAGREGMLEFSLYVEPR